MIKLFLFICCHLKRSNYVSFALSCLQVFEHWTTLITDPLIALPTAIYQVTTVKLIKFRNYFFYLNLEAIDPKRPHEPLVAISLIGGHSDEEQIWNRSVMVDSTREDGLMVNQSQTVTSITWVWELCTVESWKFFMPSLSGQIITTCFQSINLQWQLH